MTGWKTTTAGALTAFAVTAGPLSGFLASLQAIERLWIGLIQNDAPPAQQE